MGSRVLEERINVSSSYLSSSSIYESLLPNVRDSLTYEQKEFVRRLDEFEAPYLQEKLLKDSKFNSQEEYQRAFVEFKKYVILDKLTGNSPIGMASVKVDELWHQLILFTKEYSKFCNEIQGYFLHHSPHTSQTPIGKRKEGHLNFVRSYKELFGEIPSIWNVKSDSDPCDACGPDSCGPDCSFDPCNAESVLINKLKSFSRIIFII